MKFYWFNKHCCVPECFNSSTEGEGCFKEYFDLPAEQQARSRWLNTILREDSENLKICEDHFKDDEIFRDKNNRKKLKLNSVPSVKLPKHICPTCLGSLSHLGRCIDFEPRPCQCVPPPSDLQPNMQNSSVSKRTRIKWTAEEKKTLFRAVKNHGDVQIGNSKIRINWANVASYCRSHGCFGNEKELKTVWQNIRTNATKVYRNEIFGSKLERKVSRFLFGKTPKKNRGIRMKIRGSSVNESSNQEEGSTDDGDQFQEHSRQMMEEDEHSGAINNNNSEEGETKELPVEETEEEDQESDQYYSISDVEEIFQIKIRPKPPKPPAEIISLLSSDEEEEE